jgi:hypothetical protein
VPVHQLGTHPGQRQPYQRSSSLVSVKRGVRVLGSKENLLRTVVPKRRKPTQDEDRNTISV